MIDENDQPTISSIDGALTANDVHKQDWNDMHIVARDNRFILYINGKLASEFTEHLPQNKRLESGMIQLQLHDAGMVVMFRDLRVKILP